MTKDVLNWGILSTARINQALIPPLRASDRNRLVAVASRFSERAQAYAREWQIPKAYGSYQELLADEEIDVVYIPLPNHLHVAWAVNAARAGKHVLCEKPLALTAEDVDTIAGTASEAGVVVTEAFMYRHHPQTLKVKALIDEGAIGDLLLVQGSFSFVLDRPEDIRLDPAMGGGSRWDNVFPAAAGTEFSSERGRWTRSAPPESAARRRWRGGSLRTRWLRSSRS